MRIVLELHGNTYSITEVGEDFNADELKERFSRLMVAATYSPDVLEDAEGGRWEYRHESEGEE